MSYDEEPADRGVPPQSVPIVDGDNWEDENDRVADQERANSANPRALEPDTDPSYAYPDGDDEEEEEEDLDDRAEDDWDDDDDDEIEDWDEEEEDLS